jgi:hypothetical protein
VKLRYTLRAAAELSKVLGYIEEHSPQGGRRAQARIQAFINPLCGIRTLANLRPKVVCAAWWLRPIPISFFIAPRRTRS